MSTIDTGPTRDADLLMARLEQPAVAPPPLLGELLDLAGDPGALTARLAAWLGEVGALSAEPRRVWQAALARVAARTIDAWGPLAPAFDRSAYWHQSIAIAVVAERLAAAARVVDASAAFVAGLFCTVGQPAMALQLPKAYARVAQQAAEQPTPLIQLERDLLGVDHAAVGRRLAVRLGLPEAARDAAWLSHLRVGGIPRSLATRDVVACVSLARRLVQPRAAGMVPALADLAIGGEEIGAIGLTDESLRQALLSLDTQVAALLRVVGSPGPVAPRDELEEWLHQRDRRNTLLDPRRLRRGAERLAAADADDLPAALPALADAMRRALTLPTLSLACIDQRRAWIHLAAPGDETSRLIPPGPESRALCDELDSPALPERTLLPAPAAAAFLFATDRAAPTGWFVRLTVDDRTSALLLLPIGAGPARLFRRRYARIRPLIHKLGERLQRIAGRAHAARLMDDFADTSRRVADAAAAQVSERAREQVAELAAGLAHELNTPLAVISGRAQQLAAQSPEAPIAGALGALREQAENAANLVAALAEYADPPAAAPVAIAASELLAAARQRWLATGRLAAGQLRLDLSDDLPPIYVDPAWLARVFDELISNALEATVPDSRLISVKGRAVPTDDFVSIAVSDNGRGMPPEVREKAFLPFFSQRPAGRGRGLGLARVDRLVRLSGGRIRLESQPGQGTTVTLLLPIHRPATL